MTETLRTEVTAAEVRVAAAAEMAASTEPQYVHYQFLAKVADRLNVSKSTGDRGERRAWNKFCGQVDRALRKLVDEGKLAKVPGAHGTLFCTLEQYAEHLARQTQTEAARAGQQALRCCVHDELMLYGIPVASERGQEIRIEPDGWRVIIEALETARAVRSQL